MKITKNQLKRIIREEFRRIRLQRIIKEQTSLDPAGMKDFGDRFDSAYRMPSGRYRGQPDEPIPGSKTGVPVEVDVLGKELYAAYQSGDELAIKEIEAELRSFGDVGEDEIHYRSPQGKNAAKSEWDY